MMLKCIMGAALSLSLLGLAPAQQPQRFLRDWKQFPAVAEMDGIADIYAIGDIHGDFDRFVNLLATAKLIEGVPANPKEVGWRAGKSVLVCTGDFINKGTHSWDVIALLRELAPKAAADGGRVVVCLGNHEAGFLSNSNGGKQDRELAGELKAHGINAEAVAAGRDEAGIGVYLRTRPLAARVNDWFFAHAGDTDGKTMKELRLAVESQVDAGGFAAEVLLGKKGLLEARSKPHPWWEKDGDKPGHGEVRLRRYAEALGVRHIVLGHQPGDLEFAGAPPRTRGTLVERYNGLLFLIDVGMSSAVDYSKGALLHVHNGRAEKIDWQGKRELLWPKTK
jgi:Calcineurin-like phosphoesterase